MFTESDVEESSSDVSLSSYGATTGSDDEDEVLDLHFKHPAETFSANDTNDIGTTQNNVDNEEESTKLIQPGDEAGYRGIPNGIPPSLATQFRMSIDIDSCTNVKSSMKSLFSFYNKGSVVKIRSTVSEITNSFRFDIYVKRTTGYKSFKADKAISFRLGEVVCNDITHSIFWLIFDPASISGSRNKHRFYSVGKALIARILNLAKDRAFKQLSKSTSAALSSQTCVLCQLNNITPGAKVVSKALKVPFQNFNQRSAPDWHFSNEVMIHIANQVDEILADVGAVFPDLPNDGGVMAEFKTILERNSVFVSSCSGTKGILRMPYPIRVDQTAVDTLLSNSRGSISTFSNLFDNHLKLQLENGETKSFIHSAITSTLFPNLPNQRVEGETTILFDIGFSMYFEKDDLFLLSNPNLAKSAVRSTLVETRNEFQAQHQGTEVTPGSTHAGESPQEDTSQQDATDRSDIINTFEDGLIHPFADHAPYARQARQNRNDDDDDNDNDEDDDDENDGWSDGWSNEHNNERFGESSFQDGVIQNDLSPEDDVEEDRDWVPEQDHGDGDDAANQSNLPSQAARDEWFIIGASSLGTCIPDILGIRDHGSPPNAHFFADPSINYYSNIRSHLIRKDTSIYKYIFGTRYGNTHTGQPRIHLLYHQGELTGRVVLFPPPGPSGMQTYLSGEKNNNFALRHNIKPFSIAGFSATTKLLLSDNLFLAGERKSLEEDWVAAYNIINDQRQFERKILDNLQSTKLVTPDSSLVFRVEVMCTTDAKGRIEKVPYPFGILQSVQIENIFRYRKYRDDMLQDLLIPLQKLSVMIQQNLKDPSPKPQYTGGVKPLVNRMVGSADLLEQSLDMLSPASRRRKQVFTKTSKIRLFFNQMGVANVTDEEQIRRFGFSLGAKDETVEAYERKDLSAFGDMLEEYPIQRRLQLYEDVAQRRENYRAALDLRLKYRLNGPESKRRFSMKRSSHFRCSPGMDFDYAVFKTQIVGKHLLELLDPVEVHTEGNNDTIVRMPRWRSMSPMDMEGFLTQLLNHIFEAYMYDYSRLVLNQLRSYGERQTFDPLRIDCMSWMRNTKSFKEEVIGHTLTPSQRSAGGISFISCSHGLANAVTLHSAQGRQKVACRDAAIRNVDDVIVSLFHSLSMSEVKSMKTDVWKSMFYFKLYHASVNWILDWVVSNKRRHTESSIFAFFGENGPTERFASLIVDVFVRNNERGFIFFQKKRFVKKRLYVVDLDEIQKADSCYLMDKNYAAPNHALVVKAMEELRSMNEVSKDTLLTVKKELTLPEYILEEIPKTDIDRAFEGCFTKRKEINLNLTCFQCLLIRNCYVFSTYRQRIMGLQKGLGLRASKTAQFLDNAHELPMFPIQDFRKSKATIHPFELGSLFLDKNSLKRACKRAHDACVDWLVTRNEKDNSNPLKLTLADWRKLDYNQRFDERRSAKMNQLLFSGEIENALHLGDHKYLLQVFLKVRRAFISAILTAYRVVKEQPDPGYFKGTIISVAKDAAMRELSRGSGATTDRERMKDILDSHNATQRAAKLSAATTRHIGKKKRKLQVKANSRKRKRQTERPNHWDPNGSSSDSSEESAKDRGSPPTMDDGNHGNHYGDDNSDGGGNGNIDNTNNGHSDGDDDRHNSGGTAGGGNRGGTEGGGNGGGNRGGNRGGNGVGTSNCVKNCNSQREEEDFDAHDDPDECHNGHNNHDDYNDDYNHDHGRSGNDKNEGNGQEGNKKDDGANKGGSGDRQGRDSGRENSHNPNRDSKRTGRRKKEIEDSEDEEDSDEDLIPSDTETGIGDKFTKQERKLLKKYCMKKKKKKVVEYSDEEDCKGGLKFLGASKTRLTWDKETTQLLWITIKRIGMSQDYKVSYYWKLLHDWDPRLTIYSPSQIRDKWRNMKKQGWEFLRSTESFDYYWRTCTREGRRKEEEEQKKKRLNHSRRNRGAAVARMPHQTAMQHI